MKFRVSVLVVVICLWGRSMRSVWLFRLGSGSRSSVCRSAEQGLMRNDAHNSRMDRADSSTQTQ